jgi:hypothetical protein
VSEHGKKVILSARIERATFADPKMLLDYNATLFQLSYERKLVSEKKYYNTNIIFALMVPD